MLRRLDQSEEKRGNTDDGTGIRIRKEDLVLNQYEQMIATEVIAPEDIPVSFEGNSVSNSFSSVLG